MKKTLKWGIVVAFLVVTTCSLAAAKMYSDAKNTAKQMYVPLQHEQSKQRDKQVDVAVKEPFSALVLGVDDREGDGGRSDTLIVITVNPTEQSTKLLSIPRDTYTDIVGKGFKDKINHAYAYGGVEMTLQTVEQLLTIPIDYVVQVNMDSFVTLVDTFGGVTVDNGFAFHYDGVDFPTGEVQLDGDKALKYVRMRYDDPAGDFGRQQRQKAVLEQLLKQSISLTTVLRYEDILKQLENNVQFNITFDEIMSIQKNYASSFQSVEQLQLQDVSAMHKNGIYYTVISEAELQQTRQTLREHLQLQK